MKKLTPVVSICLVLSVMLINFGVGDSFTSCQLHTQKRLQEGYTEFPNLALIGDDNLTYFAAYLGWEGNGSLEFPFVIQNYLFTESTNSLSISDTTLSFEVRHCVTYGTIYCENVTCSRITSCETKGIECSKFNNGSLKNNVALSSEGAGIRFVDSNNNNITGNVVDNSGTQQFNDEWGSGIEIESCSNINLTNNTVTNSYFSGISIYYSSLCHLEENTITSNGHSYTTSGYYTCTCTTTCDCSWSYTYYYGSGIYIKYSQDIAIITNYVNLNAEGGLAVLSSKGVLVQNLDSATSLIDVSDSNSAILEESSIYQLRIQDSLDVRVSINHFSGPVDVYTSSNVNISRNELDQDLDFYQCDECHIVNNTVVSSFYLTYCTGFVINNNRIGSPGIQFYPKRAMYMSHEISKNLVNEKKLVYVKDALSESFTYNEVGQAIILNSTECSFQMGGIESTFLSVLNSNCSIKILQCSSVSLFNSVNIIVLQSGIEDLDVESCEKCSFLLCSSHSGSFHIQESDEVRIINSSFYESSITFTYTTGGKIEGNILVGGFARGIDAYRVEGLEIRNNEIIGVGNMGYRYSISAIYLMGSNCRIINNSIMHTNGVGITIRSDWSYDSSQNEIFGNMFVNNTEGNALDDGEDNSWDDGIGSGNFWDDYGGTGVYVIPGTAGSVDHYPLGQLLNTTKSSSYPIANSSSSSVSSSSSPTSSTTGINLAEIVGISITIGSVFAIILFGFLIVRHKIKN